MKGDCMKQYRLIYENPLQTPEDVAGFIAEGNPKISFDGGLVLTNGDDESLGDYAHFLYWVPQKFPDRIRIEWQFKPLEEPGLCMMFFSAMGQGKDLFDPSLPERNGYYPQYHSGAIDAYHISYYRRKYDTERCFETCNLRKSHGFHLVAQGADPLPGVADVLDFYQLAIEKDGNHVRFLMNDLLLFSYEEDGAYGPALAEGYIGFRQMAPMKACYKDLKVYQKEE